MNKSGIVLEVNNKIACLMTNDGSFVKVKIIESTLPQLGQIYSGEIYKSIPNLKLPLIAAVTSFFVFLSGGMYTYYTPAAELTIDINPSVKLTLNRWNRIIKSTPLNNDGEKILSSIKISNKKVDEGLKILVDQAKIDNFLNEENKENSNTISVHITENKNQNIDLTKFEKSLTDQNLNVEVVDDNKATPPAEIKPTENIEKNNNNKEEKNELKQDEKEIKQDEKENKQDKKQTESENEIKQNKNQSIKDVTGNSQKKDDITETKSSSKNSNKIDKSIYFSKENQNKSNKKK